MVLVSAILRTITQVLNSKAAEDKPIIAIQTSEELLENQTMFRQDIEEPDILEGVKLEAVGGGNEATHTQPLKNFKLGRRNKVKDLTLTRKDKTKEPGEILMRNDIECYSTKEKDVTKTENIKERVLSVTEQNHIISCLEKSVQLVSQLETSLGQILSCQFCSFSTEGERQRQELRIHHESVHFICKLCGDDHTSKTDLKLHLENTHREGSKYFLCGIGGCKHKENTNLISGEIQVKFRSLYVHIRKQHCALKYSCNICDMKFTVVDGLKDHLSAQHNVVTARIRSCKCPHCNKEVKYASNLQAHIRAIHRTHLPQKCTTCEFVAHSSSKLRRHVSVVHLREPTKCSSCDFETKNPETLKKHRVNQHDKELLCRYCSYKTKKTNHIRRHELTHSNVADYMCDKCDFRTKTPQSLKTHGLYHESPKYICDQCQYTSFNSANFATHKKTKHGTAQHKCDLCGQIFQYLRHLVRHQDNHQAVKFDCKECEKKFSRKDKLKEHGLEEHDLSDHDVEEKVSTKSVSCPECGKLFTQSKHLSRHKASAHGGLKFNCIHCQKTFSRKDKMNAHMNYSCKLRLSNIASGVQKPDFEEFIFE